MHVSYSFSFVCILAMKSHVLTLVLVELTFNLFVQFLFGFKLFHLLCAYTAIIVTGITKFGVIYIMSWLDVFHIVCSCRLSIIHVPAT